MNKWQKVTDSETQKYFKNEIKPLLKSVQTFKENGKLWVQYDIKFSSGKDVSKIHNYLKNKYKQVYPRIQKFDGGFIGDIQFVA